MTLTGTLIVSMLSILLVLNIQFIHFTTSQNDNDLEDDIAFLESQEEQALQAIQSTTTTTQHDADQDFTEDDNLDDQETPSMPNVDEKDVVVLKANNFTEFIEQNKYVLVEFYAPWCGHCQALAPEYAAAATELKGLAALAKVDGTEESGLLEMYEVEGFPTLFLFVDGVHRAYDGARSKDAIVNWVKKKTGPAVFNITTMEEAERILATESIIVLGFLDPLLGPESEELAAASRLEDDVTFYQTTNPEVAKLFHIEPKVNHPALVLLKEEAEKLSLFDGQFSQSAIAEFVSCNKFPLVVALSRENVQSVFDSPIKKQLLLFAPSNGSEKILPKFQEAAKFFKGKIIFVYVDTDDKDFGKQVSDFFGIAREVPKIVASILGYDGKNYVLNGELALSEIKSFAEDFLKDNLKPFYKSDPIPETNDGDVKIVVGKNFDQIVLDESKDVLLEIYAPWCGHCQALEPIYNRLAKYLKGIDSLVISKMDGTTNEHPWAEAEKFPTLLFFPAGKKSIDPITVESDCTVVAFYKFLKKHVSIPFKLQKPASTEKLEDSGSTKKQDSNDNNVKDGSINNDVKDEL